MQLRFLPRAIPDRWINARSWAVLSAVAVFWFLALKITPSITDAVSSVVWLPSCPLKTLTSISCPFCGITTGGAWLVRGNLIEAWHSNILSPLLGLALAVSAAYTVSLRLFAGYSLVFDADAQARRALWMLTVILVLVSWGVNLHRVN